MTALFVGAYDLSFASLLSGDETGRTIFFRIRLPRVLLAGLVGGALAASGAALQPMLRNPLASPDIIGVSGGAALAAVCAIALWAGHAMLENFVPFAAFVGAMVSTAIVYRLSLVNGRLEPYTQVLIGVIFNTFAASLILLVSALVDVSRSQSIVFWLMGGIAVHTYSVLAVVAAAVVIGIIVLLRDARSLDLLALGDETAEQLGVNLRRVRTRVFGASALLVGAVVSLTGVIAFVGLVVPHILRRIVGSDNRLLIPASVFGGAAFLILCDMIARTVVAPSELPVGAITAMTGGPFFVYLLRRTNRTALR